MYTPFESACTVCVSYPSLLFPGIQGWNTESLEASLHPHPQLIALFLLYRVLFLT